MFRGSCSDVHMDGQYQSWSVISKQSEERNRRAFSGFGFTNTIA